MSSGYWNRAGRRSGGDRKAIIRMFTPGTHVLQLDPDFMLALIAYSAAKQAVYDCECEQGHCEHVTAMLDAAKDIADRLVADPASSSSAVVASPASPENTESHK